MRPDTFLQALHDWQNFYTLLGEASATLAGLMFVAAILGARLINEDSDAKVRTLLTPTVLYFSLVLLSALMNISTQTRAALTVQLFVVGLIGAGYSLSRQASILHGGAERGGGRCPAAPHGRPPQCLERALTLA